MTIIIRLLSRSRFLRVGSALILAIWLATAIGLSAQTFVTLHSFNRTDGQYPEAALTQGRDGNFYGTNEYGGAHGCGTVFKITASGRLTTLQSFNGTDGCDPQASLLQATDGNFYSTTLLGGANGEAVIFKITPSGTLSTLHNFDYSDGYATWVGLVQATDGNFYGTTYYCGANSYGTVWKESKGKDKILHSGSYSSTDIAYMGGGVTLDKKGNLYGLSEEGGASTSYGALYELSPKGTLTLLHSFDYTDGGYPWGDEVLLTTKGTMYGPTVDGGSDYDGTVWSYVP